MTRRTAPILNLLVIVMAALLIAPVAGAQTIKELPELEGVGIIRKVGEQVPQDIYLKDSQGRQVSSAEFFDGERPVLLVLAYYDCPMLCTLVLDEVQQAMNEMNWTAGDQYRVITVSFDHTNTTEDARRKRDAYLAGYDREDLTEDAWMFLTGDATSVRRLSDSVGYQYRFLPESGEYSHPAAIIFLRPDGVVHNYMESLEYPAKNVKLALFEASEGKSGSVFEKVVLTCFQYDPKTGQYVIAPMQVMRLGASGTAILLAIVVGTLFIRYKTRSSKPRSEDSSDVSNSPAGVTN